MAARMRHADAVILAMKAARANNQDQLALEILDGTAVRVYTRTSKSRPGWQFHWNRPGPVPEGTEIVILMDAYDTNAAPKFSLVPVKQFRDIVAPKRHTRPLSPDSDHCYVTPDDAEEWLNYWAIRDFV